MENRTRNIVMSLLFFAFLIFLIVGGYIYTKDLKDNKNKIENKKEEKAIDFRVDKEKEYIYFENEEVISVDPEITFSDVIINLDGADIINSMLKTEMSDIRKSVVKLDDSNRDETKELLYAETDIYSANERTYDLYKSKEFYSVIISDLEFNCYTDFLIKKIKGYVIDIKNGKILTNEDLMNKYNLSLEDIKNKVTAKLDQSQSVSEDGIEVIDKEETLNSLFDSYALYIDGTNLYISYIVKSNFVNYNDSVILN